MDSQVERPELVRVVLERLRRNPVVALIGARQVGKTTLALTVAKAWGGPCEIFDLEQTRSLERLADPETTLEPLRGLVVLDEIHRRPELFPTLRVLADRRETPARFLVLGSASPDLLKQSSETLAGRISYIHVPGFGPHEIGIGKSDQLWLRGAFPRSFLAEDDAASMEWRSDFMRTFLERDIPSFGIGFPPATLERFWHMLAHWHGQIWNASEFARSFGVSDATVRRYLDALRNTFMVRILQPWHANIAKRQVKAPRVYIEDSGILHALLDIDSGAHLVAHPKVGASWEGYVSGLLAQRLRARPEDCYYWRTHMGAELDLLVVRGLKKRGFEIKRTVAPGLTPSMKIALEDLELASIDVVHAGEETYPLTKGVRAVALRRLLEDVEPL